MPAVLTSAARSSWAGSSSADPGVGPNPEHVYFTERTMNTEIMDLCTQAVAAARKAGADGAEAFATRRRTREVVYEKNDLNLARADEELAIGIRVLAGKSMAFVSTNEPAALAEAARQAVAIARISPPDDHNALPEGAAVDPTDGELYDPAVAQIEPEDLTRLTAAVVDGIARRDARVAIDQVRLSVEEVFEAIASSSGARGQSEATYLSGFVMGMVKEGEEVGSFTYDGAAGNVRSAVTDELWRGVDRFVEKAVGALRPRKGRSFQGTVLLTPDAVGEILVGPLLEALGADAVRKGRSPLAGRLGDLVAAPAFTLRDPGHRLGCFGGRTFDREGLPIRPLDLIGQGALHTFLYDSYEARVAGRSSTGHAQGGATSPPRPGAGMIEVLPGSEPAAVLERDLGLALLVPRFSGRVEMATGDFSGVVKGGFLLENGERMPVAETMIAGNLYEALKHIVALSSDRLQLFGSTRFPTIAIEGIVVTAG